MAVRMATVVAVMSMVTAAAVSCSPAPKALLAVERTESGRARILVAPCPRYTAQMFSFFSSGGTIGYKRWFLMNDSMRGSLASVDLFEPPQGWSVRRSELVDLKGGREYTAVLRGGVNGRGLDGRISFTPDLFDRLKPGKVLVPDGEGAKMVKRSEFMKKDADRCTPG
ncbi:hypothetical protein ACQKM2_15675 [Streptomyces sp. NPDC004126]|uniref:hypothetical protein n=1 Tax=Streptomyces sp. NPDC004126 TaxID=3390695 RepID=UPI003D044A0C